LLQLEQRRVCVTLGADDGDAGRQWEGFGGLVGQEVGGDALELRAGEGRYAVSRTGHLARSLP
jgi:hypothetical protein